MFYAKDVSPQAGSYTMDEPTSKYCIMVLRHTAGDEVLRNISTYLRSCFSEGDFVARYGGEEFAIILDEGNRVLVQKVLEGMRESISKQKFSTGDEMISVTVSVGIAFCKWHDTTESLIKRADKTLYTAKKGGRNTVVTEDSF